MDTKQIDKLIQRIAERAMADIEKNSDIRDEKINALANLMRARALFEAPGANYVPLSNDDTAL